MNRANNSFIKILAPVVAAVLLQGLCLGLAQEQSSSGQSAPSSVVPAAEPQSVPEAADRSLTLPEDPEPSEPPEPQARDTSFHRRPAGGELISYGKDVEVKSNETAEVVVVIGGSARIYGKVRDAVVVIGGSIEISGEAQSGVAIFGNVKMIGASQLQEAVAILGNVQVTDSAETREAVAVGGKVEVLDKGHVAREKVSLGLPGFAAPEWVQRWFRECVMKLRPLAPQVGWIWAVAGVVLLFYLLVALVFQAPVKACVDEIVNRPASSFLVGLLTKMLLPALLLILAFTGVGVFVLPFLFVALLVMGIFGKVAILQATGSGLGRTFGISALERPLLAFFTGAVIMALLYMVPVLGFIVLFVSGMWGLGAVVMAASGRIRREMPSRPKPQAAASWAPREARMAIAQSPPASAGSASAGAGGNETGEKTFVPGNLDQTTHPNPPVCAVPPVGDVMTYPFAGLWERVGAAFLDVILVSIAGSLVGGAPWSLLVALAYFAGMWAWRGTTIGGIVIGLKVVRLDGQPVSFSVALVRGLAAAFSIVVLFLGFLWIAWDREKQGWHDKIAGTVVLKLPRGVPLVCV